MEYGEALFDNIENWPPADRSKIYVKKIEPQQSGYLAAYVPTVFVGSFRAIASMTYATAAVYRLIFFYFL